MTYIIYIVIYGLIFVFKYKEMEMKIKYYIIWSIANFVINNRMWKTSWVGHLQFFYLVKIKYKGYPMMHRNTIYLILFLFIFSDGPGNFSGGENSGRGIYLGNIPQRFERFQKIGNLYFRIFLGNIPEEESISLFGEYSLKVQKIPEKWKFFFSYIFLRF